MWGCKGEGVCCTPGQAPGCVLGYPVLEPLHPAGLLSVTQAPASFLALWGACGCHCVAPSFSFPPYGPFLPGGKPSPEGWSDVKRTGEGPLRSPSGSSQPETFCGAICPTGIKQHCWNYDLTRGTWHVRPVWGRTWPASTSLSLCFCQPLLSSVSFGTKETTGPWRTLAEQIKGVTPLRLLRAVS